MTDTTQHSTHLMFALPIELTHDENVKIAQAVAEVIPRSKPLWAETDQQTATETVTVHWVERASKGSSP